MSDNILTSTKKVLGIGADYEAFDVDILMHINSVFSTLHQLGIGPVDGFFVDEESTWSSFLGNDNRMNSVKTFTYLRVRLVFDPPGTSYLIESLRKQAEELAWRLNVAREETAWSEPSDPLLIDGGSA